MSWNGSCASWFRNTQRRYSKLKFPGLTDYLFANSNYIYFSCCVSLKYFNLVQAKFMHIEVYSPHWFNIAKCAKACKFKKNVCKRKANELRKQVKRSTTNVVSFHFGKKPSVTLNTFLCRIHFIWCTCRCITLWCFATTFGSTLQTILSFKK